jgi:multimeric flavodoxin WrbA
MSAQHIVALVGSYRRGGTTAQVVEAALEAARAEGATTETIWLSEQRIAFCDNCRRCTQEAGSRRGACHLEDDLEGVFDRLDAADALILASPVNNLDVTAVTRAVLERMVAYFHWPWGEPAPVARRSVATRPSVLMTSSAMPGWMGRFATRSLGTLTTMARILGTKPIGKLYVGLAAGSKDASLKPADLRRARALGSRLVTDN